MMAFLNMVMAQWRRFCRTWCAEQLTPSGR
jgi:hypothetical protein